MNSFLQPTSVGPRTQAIGLPTMRETSDARLNLFTNFVVAGSAAVAARAAVNGYSVMKICAEVGVPGHKMGIVRAFLWTHHLEGFRGFFKGLPIAAARSFPHVGLQFTVFDQLVKCYVPETVVGGKPSFMTSAGIFVCGGVAGSVATMFTHPLDVVKTRLVVQGFGAPDVYKGVGDCISKILKNQGVFGLYRGIVPSVVGASIFSAEMFTLWDFVNRIPWMRYDKPFVYGEWFLWPCVAVSVATVVAHPLDVVRRKMMAFDATLPKFGRVDVQAEATYETIFNILKFNGFNGFLHGITANVLKVLPQVAVFWVAYKSVQFVAVKTVGKEEK